MNRPFGAGVKSGNIKIVWQSWLALTPVLLVMAFLVLGSTLVLVPAYDVYDSKRLVQLWILVALPAVTLLTPALRVVFNGLMASIPRFLIVALLLFFLLGLASALAHPPWFYPLADVALLFLIGVAVLVLAASRVLAGALFDRIALGGVAFLSAAMAVQESMGFVAGIVLGLPFNYEIMFAYFAHPRLYNDLQVVVIPLLAALPWVFGDSRRTRLLAVALLALQWCLLFMSGGRASTLGLCFALLLGGVLLWRQRPRWLGTQTLGLSLGTLLFAGLLGLQGELFDNSPAAGKLAKESLGHYTAPHSSGRNHLWSAALEQSRQHPWLGIGPARFACVPDRGSGAHPHNFALQLAAEWGWPATLLLASVIAWLGWRMLASLLRPPPQSAIEPLRQVLSLSLLAAAVNASLSGMLAMPAGQTAVALAGGWLLGLGRGASSVGSQRTAWLQLIPSMLLAIWLAVAGTREANWLHGQQLDSSPNALPIPRLWQTGDICRYEG